MNFIIPEEKEIRTAFADGEEAVVALFGGVTAQFEELAAQPENQPDPSNKAIQPTSNPLRSSGLADG